MGYNVPFNPVIGAVFNPAQGASKTDSYVTSLPKELSPEKQMIEDQYKDLINNFGQLIFYKRNNSTKFDYLYGEGFQKSFADAKPIKAFVQYDENVSFFSRFGQETRTKLNVSITIEDFKNVFGEVPLVGDVFSIQNHNIDTTQNLDPEIYEISFVDDRRETDAPIFSGSYIWTLKAVKFEYSKESNIRPETGQGYINDSAKINSLIHELNGNPTESNIDLEAAKDFKTDKKKKQFKPLV